MRIAFLTEEAGIGGGESNLLALAASLAIEHRVAVTCPPGPLFDRLAAAGLAGPPLYRPPGRRWFRGFPLPGTFPALERWLERFDIVHAYSLHVLPWLASLSRVRVWTLHGPWEGARGLRARRIEDLTDAVVAVSHDVARQAAFPRRPPRVIPLGVLLPPWPQRLRPRDPGRIRLVCAGRFQAIKGQDRLLNAVERIHRRPGRPILELHFVGGPGGGGIADRNFQARVMRQAGLLQHPRLQIHFHGFRPNVADYLRDADLVVVPSHYESFSMVTIEALALGRPVLAPDRGGPQEILRPDCGLLFPPRGDDGLTETLDSFVTNADRFHPDACRARAEHFSIEGQAKALTALYRELLHD